MKAMEVRLRMKLGRGKLSERAGPNGKPLVKELVKQMAELLQCYGPRKRDHLTA